MYKKIAILTACLLLLSSIACAAAHFSDTDGMPCADAVELLSDIGVVEGKGEGLFDPAGALTRAEMTTITLRLLGVAPASGGEGIFADVTSAHWAYNTVNAAYAMGIVNGVDETHFAPDVPLTYPQAVKMLVCALGYGVQAEAMGGYPAGYLSKAAQLGLLKNVGEGMTRGDMAILADNALSCNIFVRSGDTYAEQAGATLLNTYLHITLREGRITDNGAANIDGARRARGGSVVLGGNEKFTVGASDAAQYLGMRVKLYTKETDAEPTVLSVRSESTAVTVAAKDIDIAKTTATRLYYDDGKTMRYVAIAANAMFVYNGEKADTLTVPVRGNVTCIFENGGEASVVMVHDYLNVVVKGKDVDAETVYLKEAMPPFGTELVISAADAATHFTNADGTDATVGQCSAWNVLSVARSTDGKRTAIVRSEKKIAGKVTEFDGEHVTLSMGATYETDAAVTLGTVGVFYLDAADRIAAVDVSAAAVAEAEDGGTQYGYLTSSGMTKGLEQSPLLKIFGQDGSMQVYTVGENVSVKLATAAAKNYKANEFFLSAANHIATSDFELQPQLIRFAANEEYVITALETYAAGTTEAVREECFSLDETINVRTLYLGGQLRTFLSRYYLGDNCVIFNLPPAYSDNDKDYRIIKVSEIEHATWFTNMEFYDADRGNRVSAIIMRDSMAETVGNNAMVGVVTDVCTRMDDTNGEVVGVSITNYKGVPQQLTAETTLGVLFGTNGEAKNVITDITTETETENGQLKDKISPPALNRGDVVAYETAGDKITSMAVRFRAAHPLTREMGMDSGTARASERDSSYTSQIFWYSTVVNATDETMVVHVPATKGTDPYWVRVEPLKTDAKIFVFDTKKQTLSPATADMIQENSHVFTYRATIYPRMIILYK